MGLQTHVWNRVQCEAVFTLLAEHPPPASALSQREVQLLRSLPVYPTIDADDPIAAETAGMLVQVRHA